ncbi:MAG: hypothetical protein II368_04615 [Clostridia bacterium]|jgi:hypothetical protein|nr:hypothetical protein [Clostridia bacterium]MBQ1942915.1 hypothetical protein [Clostridia bacterium]
MVKLWAKTVKNHHIIRQETYMAVEKYDSDRFFVYLTDCCGLLDIETPVVLETHKKTFERFHHVRFRPSDFMDTVEFDYLLIEQIKE